MSECIDCGSEIDEQAAACNVCETTRQVDRPRLVAVAAITAKFITGSSINDLDRQIGDLWPIDDAVCYSFIGQVENKFRRKNKYHSYYSEQAEVDSMPARLSSFISGAKSFSELVYELMDELVLAAIDSGSSRISGGNVVFMHYKDSANDEDDGRLLAIMVDSTSGFKFDQNLVPENANHINLQALKQAALFDLTLFSATYPNAPEHETYLKFIQGTSTGAFFKHAFGCESRADNGRSISGIHSALAQYQEDNNLSDTFYDAAKRSIERAFTSALEFGRQVPLKTIAASIESNLPPRSGLEGTFEDFVNDNNYEVNEYIEPTNYALNAVNWVDIQASDESFKAKIFKATIGSAGAGRTVEYNVSTRKLSLVVSDDQSHAELSRLVRMSES